MSFGRYAAFSRLRKAIRRLPEGAIQDRAVREQLRRDWTEYCTCWGVAETPRYHQELMRLWEILREPQGLSTDDYWAFCVFMGRYLPRGARE